MMTKASDVIGALQGKTLVTAESLTGGMIGSALTAVPGASAVYKGGVVSYVNAVKEEILGVPADVLEKYGAVSAQTAGHMAAGVRKLLKADYSVSVTGLAGPTGDEFGHTVGTVFIGFESDQCSVVKEYHFPGGREEVRKQTVETALTLLLEYL
jgi:PncC family amidohydrolase